MTQFFTSDLHFSHTNIIEYTSRPYADVEEMNDDIVARYNSLVSSEDEVYILGDLAMGRKEISLAWVTQLNGIKHLVPGNHDKMFGTQGQKYAHAVQMYIEAGITDVLEEQITLNIGSLTVEVCHFPYQGDHTDQHEDRYQDHRPVNNGQFLVHGHMHGTYRRNYEMIDVGVDAWGGYPVSFEDIEDLFNSVEIQADVIPWIK